MRNLFYLAIVFMLYSCGSGETAHMADEETTPALESLTTELYRFDTTSAVVVPTAVAPAPPDKWTGYAEYFPVYRLSPSLMGIALDINSTLSPFEVVVAKITDLKTDGFADTSGFMTLRSSPKLRDYFFNSDTSRTLYIYCMRGRTQARVTDVFYDRDEEGCNANLVFALSVIDTAIFGIPLIASKKKLDMVYGKLHGFDADLEKYEKYMSQKADFVDSTYSRQFAYNKDVIMSYKDNFNWYRKAARNIAPDKLAFPGRTVFSRRGTKIKPIGGGGLDLMGTPCI